jgi:hypothetical protein
MISARLMVANSIGQPPACRSADGHQDASIIQQSGDGIRTDFRQHADDRRFPGGRVVDLLALPN